jgi:NDP-4-keto-2,6-dideoxyhexose 3-C-methyltransferase
MRVAIDPSAYEECNYIADAVVKDYFSYEAFRNAKTPEKAAVITCCAMMYDLTDPVSFLKDVDKSLKDDGIFVAQLSYTPLMLIQKELGNICHEHAAYYTFQSLEICLRMGGFKVLDVDLNEVNGGSIRVYCIKNDTDESLFRTQACRDVADIKKASLRDFEYNNAYNERDTYITFFKRMLQEKEKAINFLKDQKAAGKSVIGYAASTKANTVLQWMGIGPDLIPKIAERQERKVGLLTSGSNIPICSEEEARADKPDFMVVFAWHFISEFKEREAEYLKAGGKLVTFSPKFEIHGL